MPSPPVVVAQALDDQTMLAGWKWLLAFLAGLAVTFLLFIVVVKLARRTLELDEENISAPDSVLSLTELRRLRDAGELTQEQYEKLRDKFAAIGERKLTKPKGAPRPEPPPPADDATGPAGDSDNAPGDGPDDNPPA
ncbi:MAG: SHOCT domain-containing protein [Planctomycetes bacterium]|nr:SHOCT domain-containing protein [Planctomycetota bacterium]